MTRLSKLSDAELEETIDGCAGITMRDQALTELMIWQWGKWPAREFANSLGGEMKSMSDRDLFNLCVHAAKNRAERGEHFAADYAEWRTMQAKSIDGGREWQALRERGTVNALWKEVYSECEARRQVLSLVDRPLLAVAREIAKGLPDGNLISRYFDCVEYLRAQSSPAATGDRPDDPPDSGQ